MIEQLNREFKSTLRSLAKSPVFCITAVLTLALGCAATSTIFSILRATLLKPLPYVAPERIVTISAGNVGHNIVKSGLSPGDYEDLKSSLPVFSDTAYSTDQTYTLSGTGEPETLIGYQFSSNFLPLLGVNPLLGRNFSVEEVNSGAKVVLLSYEFWMRRFGGDQNILGKPITLEGAPYTVIGIMSREFVHPSPAVEVWTPLKLDAAGSGSRNVRFLQIIARLAPGVTLQQAQMQLHGLSERLQQSFPREDAGWSIEARSIRDSYVGDIRTPVLVLQCAAVVLLLIACANLSNLLVARAIAQQKQFAIRMALGAARSVVVTRIASEAFILSLGGALAGAALAIWALSVLPGLAPSNVLNLAIPSLRNVSLSWSSLTTSVITCFLVSSLMGVAPIWRRLASDLAAQSLTDGNRGTSRAASRNFLRSGLVIAEVSLSLLLLIGSGLMIRTMLHLQNRNLGFDADNILTLRIVAPVNRYSDTASVAVFLDQVLPRIAAIPGVKSAAVANVLPLSGMGARRPFHLADDARMVSNQQQADFRVVTPDFFRTLNIPLVKGRVFDNNDHAGSRDVVLINEALAKLFPRGEDPIGKKVITPDLGQPSPKEIVGIVGDVRYDGFAGEPNPTIYRSFAQAYWPILSFAVRSSSSPTALLKPVSAAIWQADRALPINAAASMERLRAESLALHNLAMMILCLFSGTGVLLVALGLYGLIAYEVTQRFHEIGIRSALGARKSDILWLIVRQAMILVLIGQAIGIGISLFVTRILTSLLFGVRPNDITTFLSVCLLIALVSAAACLVPSMRAVRIDPAVVLHSE